MPAATPPIELPEPCLVVLVGPAGSGKSTFAARHFHPDEVVSSDALREALTGDAADQSANRAVFAALHREVGRRLAGGSTTAVDATNVERHARRALLRIAARVGVPTLAIVFDLPLEVVLRQNAARGGRSVPADVAERHHGLLRLTLARDAWASEGFAVVHVLRGAAALDRARVVRNGGSTD